MAKLLKLRRGTTTQHGSFTGAEGEVTIDTTKDTAVVHDGSTAGGRALLREDASNLPDQAIQLNHLPHGTSSNDGKFLRANNGADPTFETVNTDLVADTSPQLGGNLDLNGSTINGTGNISISGNLSGNALTINNNSININGTEPTLSFIDSNANPDFEIKVNGGTFDIRDSTNNTSKFQIASGELAAQAKLNCQAGLDTDGDVQFNSGTTNMNMLWDASAKALKFDDSVSATFGTGGDLQILHNGTDSVLNDAGTGNLKFMLGGATQAEVVSNGFTVTGTCTANAFAGDGSALTGIDAFPSGTKMLFQQTAAPTGWTKVTSGVDNKALRVVSGTAGSGGSNAFSNTLASRSITANSDNTTITGNVSVANATQGGNVSVSIANASTGGTVNSHTLSTNEMPSHSHNLNGGNYMGGTKRPLVQNTGTQYNASTGNTGGGGGHSHGFTGGSHSHNANASFSGSAHTHNATFTAAAHNHSISVTNLDLAVQYLDVIIASKD